RQRELGPLDREDGVLEARVVELHHVGARDSAPSEASRQVDVDEVEASGTETQVAGRDVDHDLVADLDRPDEGDVGHGRAPLAVHLHFQALHRPARVAGLDHRAAVQAQHATAASSTRANVTSSMPSSAATLTRSPGSWL